MNLLLSHGNSYEQWVSGICEMWKDILSTFVQNSINALNRRDNSEKSVLKKRPWSFRKTSCSFLKRTKSFSKSRWSFWRLLRTLNIKRKWVFEKDELVHLFQIRSVSAFFFRNFFGNALKKDRCQQSAVIISQIKLLPYFGST